MDKLTKILFSISDVISTTLCGFLLLGACITPFALIAQGKMQSTEVSILSIVISALVIFGYSFSFYLISKRNLKGFILLVTLSILHSSVTWQIMPVYIFSGIAIILFTPCAMARKNNEIF